MRQEGVVGGLPEETCHIAVRDLRRIAEGRTALGDAACLDAFGEDKAVAQFGKEGPVKGLVGIDEK